MPNVVQSNACPTDRPTNRPIVWFLMKNIQICQFWTELYLFTCYVPPPPRPTSSPIFSVVKTDLIMDYLWDHLLISTTNQPTNHSPSLCESTNNTTNTKFIKNIYICIKPYYQMSSIKPLCLSTIPKALNGKDLTIYNFFSLSLLLS